jgi:hypothetical protein
MVELRRTALRVAGAALRAAIRIGAAPRAPGLWSDRRALAAASVT